MMPIGSKVLSGDLSFLDSRDWVSQSPIVGKGLMDRALRFQEFQRMEIPNLSLY